MGTFWTTTWGDLATAVGLVVGLVGFAMTLRAVRATRQRVNELRQEFWRLDVATEVTAAVTELRQIMSLQQEHLWNRALGEYVLVITRLGRLTAAGGGIPEHRIADVHSVCRHLEQCRRVVEGGQAVAHAVNGIIMDQIIQLQGILGGAEHGIGTS